MTVALDAVGPAGGAGQAGAGVSSLSWTHVIGASATEITIGFSASASTPAVTSVKVGTTSCTLVAKADVNGSGSDGEVYKYHLSSPPTGSQTIAVTMSAASDMEAGSVSYAGSGSLGTPVTAHNPAGTAQNSVQATVSTTSASSIVDFNAAAGSAFSVAAATGTARWVADQNPASAAGNGCGVTAPGTAGSVTPAITLQGGSTDWWGAVAVEVLPGGGAVSGTASLAGAGAVSALVTERALSSPAGAGSVTATVTGAATATAAGAGALSALVTQAVPAAATGAGSLSALVTEAVPASLAGSGSASGLAAQPATGSAAAAGAVSALVTERVTATAAGSGSALANPGGTVTGTASLAASGSVLALAAQPAPATAAAAGAVLAKAAAAVPASLAGTGLASALALQGATATAAGSGSALATGRAAGAFTAGALTAGTAPAALLTAATASPGTLTATTTTAGGPS